MGDSGAVEPTDLLRGQHEVIRVHLRRLERGLALVLAATERGAPPLGLALEWARASGAALRLLIPKHVKEEEELLTAAADTAAGDQARAAEREHGEVGEEYREFLRSLGALVRSPLDPGPVRDLSLRVHGLADLLGRHMRHEEEVLFPALERSLSTDAKRALVARFRRQVNPGPRKMAR